jgi:SAP domain
MTLYARNDITLHMSGITGHTHRRPQKDDGSYVPVWGIDCPACEVELGGNPAWSASRYKIPLTPDEEAEAADAKAAADMAMQQAQLAIARDAAVQSAAARGAHPDINPEDIAISTGEDQGEEATGSAQDPETLAANYLAMNKNELKDLARDRGLPVSGTAQDLVARHVEYDQK